MKLFIDANVLIAVLNKEIQHFATCARVLSLAGNKKFELVTSPMCLAISFHFAQKKSGEKIAKNKIAVLLQHCSVSDNNKHGVINAIENKKIHDFEDGLEYYAALSAKCKCIITNDTEDFYFSEIEVIRPGDFLIKYVL